MSVLVLHPLLHICFWPLERGCWGTGCGTAPGCLSCTERSKQAYSGYPPLSGVEHSKLNLIKKLHVPKSSHLLGLKTFPMHKTSPPPKKNQRKQIPCLKSLDRNTWGKSVLRWITNVLVSSFSAGISYIFCAPR